MDPDQHVGYRDVLKVARLGVGEVHLGFPDFLHQQRVGDVEWSGEGVVDEPTLDPALSQVQIGRVVLCEISRNKGQKASEKGRTSID